MRRKLHLFTFLFLGWLNSQTVFAQQVMLQGWYWDYPKTGQGFNWSDTLRLKASGLSQSGFTHVWYPPFAGNGNKSGGYDPKDLFVGPAQTSLGTLGQIKTMVSSFTAVGITPVADMVYNHRDAGAPEANDGVKDYITKYASGNGSYGFKRPFPSDRYRMIIPIGGNRPEGAGTYYIKMRSRGSIFNGAKYAFYATTNKIGGSRWSPVNSTDVDLASSADQFQYGVQLGRNYLNKIHSDGDIDEFAVTVTASDFNVSGDSLIIQAINYDSEYSDHLPIDIYYAPAGGGGSYNIADYTNPFGANYKLIFQTYTDFRNMPSGRGGLRWDSFRPHFTSSSPAGWSQTTSLGPQYSMQSLDYFYDYDHNIPAARDTLIAWTKWAYDELGSKGLRMDAVKHFEPSFVAQMLNEMNRINRNPNLVVGEWYGENTDELKGWVDAVSNQLTAETRSAVPVKVFDFALRRALKEALDNGANARQVYFSSLRDAKGMSGFNVMTFLNNHDFRSSNPTYGDALVHNNPILGYAYLLTNNQLGVPAVFYPDYYGYPVRNSTFGTDTYGFDYHPTSLKPINKEIDQLIRVLKTYINNSPGVDYLNHYGGTGNGPQAPNNYIEGNYNRCLIYQLKAPGQTGKEVIVAINFGDTRLRVDHLIAVRNGITPATRFLDVLGKSAFPYAQVDSQNRIYIDLPAKSYSVWVQNVSPISATLATAPSNATFCPGQNAMLSATVTGGTAPYTYAYSPGLTPTQSLSMATATTTGPHSVTVTDALGLTAVTSVTLAFSEATTITQEPASASAVCAGSPVQVSVAATGPGTLSYQWYRTGTNAAVAGLNTATLSIAASQSSDAGSYYSVITSGCTSLTSAAFTLTVHPAAEVPVLTPSAGTVCSPGSLTVTASCPTTTNWTVQGGVGQTASTGSAENNLYILSQPGTYTLMATCTTAEGCLSGVSAQVSVTVNPAATASLTASNGGILTCAQPSITLMATGGVQYDFAGPDFNQTSATSTATVMRVGTYIVTVADANGCMATAQTEVTADLGEALRIASVAAPLSPQMIGTSVSLSATLGGTNLAGAGWLWQWGDGTSSSGTVTGTSLVVSHTYQTQGVFTPTLSVTTACGQTDLFTSQYIVIYNPEGGFVTGGGWLASPKGAYKANPELSGKATFGFVAKYKKGATVPDGNTEFQFKAGNLLFKSMSYDDMRLIIAGARANYKGQGTINGTGGYGFLVSAIDGQVSGGGGADKFRIKIWNTATDQVVYDNNLSDLNMAENADPETAIGGGSIVIHSTKASRESAESELAAEPILLRNFPNPVDTRTTIEFMLPQGGAYSLDIQDMKGSLIQTLQTGRAEAGQRYQVSWDPGNIPTGLYLSRLVTKQGASVLKILVK